MTTTHTPGPWIVESDDGVDFTVLGGKSSQVRIAVECGERDARLIASAPELLDALQGLIGSLAKLKSGDYVVGRDSVWLDAARAAIARATA